MVLSNILSLLISPDRCSWIWSTFVLFTLTEVFPLEDQIPVKSTTKIWDITIKKVCFHKHFHQNEIIKNVNSNNASFLLKEWWTAEFPPDGNGFSHAELEFFYARWQWVSLYSITWWGSNVPEVVHRNDINHRTDYCAIVLQSHNNLTANLASAKKNLNEWFVNYACGTPYSLPLQSAATTVPTSVHCTHNGCPERSEWEPLQCPRPLLSNALSLSIQTMTFSPVYCTKSMNLGKTRAQNFKFSLRTFSFFVPYQCNFLDHGKLLTIIRYIPNNRVSL